MAMKITVTKEVSVDNKRVYIVKSITGVNSKNDLPAKYLAHTPCFYREGSNYYLVLDKSEDIDHALKLCPGARITLGHFTVLLSEIEAAGERLHLINNERRKTQETWAGQQTFVV